MPDNGSVLGDFGAAYQGNGVTKQCFRRGDDFTDCVPLTKPCLILS
jgi:hypothetical protein